MALSRGCPITALHAIEATLIAGSSKVVVYDCCHVVMLESTVHVVCCYESLHCLQLDGTQRDEKD